MKIGKSDLIDIDCVDKSVEIVDTLVSFIDLSWFLAIYIGRYISSSVHQKSKNENWIHETVDLLTIESRRIWTITLSHLKKIFLKNLIFSLKPGLKSSSDGWYLSGL